MNVFSRNKKLWELTLASPFWHQLRVVVELQGFRSREDIRRQDNYCIDAKIIKINNNRNDNELKMQRESWKSFVK